MSNENRKTLSEDELEIIEVSINTSRYNIKENGIDLTDEHSKERQIKILGDILDKVGIRKKKVNQKSKERFSEQEVQYILSSLKPIPDFSDDEIGEDYRQLVRKLESSKPDELFFEPLRSLKEASEKDTRLKLFEHAFDSIKSTGKFANLLGISENGAERGIGYTSGVINISHLGDKCEKNRVIDFLKEFYDEEEIDVMDNSVLVYSDFNESEVSEISERLFREVYGFSENYCLLLQEIEEVSSSEEKILSNEDLEEDKLEKPNRSAFPPCVERALKGSEKGNRNYGIIVLLSSFLSYARIMPSGKSVDRIADYIDDISIIEEDVFPLIFEAADRCKPPLQKDHPNYKKNVYYHMGFGKTNQPKIKDSGKSPWYRPPNCVKIKAEAKKLCNPDKLCSKIKNPLTYYYKHISKFDNSTCPWKDQWK